jgi:hypothetical protein
MDENEAVMHLVAALLPGGAGFPAAGHTDAGTGIGPVVAGRLRTADPALPARLLAAVMAESAPPADQAAWTAAAARLEADQPRLFDELRKYAYLTYYEQPAVIEAIRTLGHPYNDTPLPDGYPDEPFVAARDAPRHKRGRWLEQGEGLCPSTPSKASL